MKMMTLPTTIPKPHYHQAQHGSSNTMATPSKPLDTNTTMTTLLGATLKPLPSQTMTPKPSNTPDHDLEFKLVRAIYATRSSRVTGPKPSKNLQKKIM
jgi:hypothetical protein